MTIGSCADVTKTTQLVPDGVVCTAQYRPLETLRPSRKDFNFVRGEITVGTEKRHKNGVSVLLQLVAAPKQVSSIGL